MNQNNQANLRAPLVNDPQTVQLNKKIGEIETKICGEATMLIFFACFLIFDGSNKCLTLNINSIRVFLAYLVIFRIPLNTNKESMAGLFCGALSKAFLTGWIIYSMVVYFNNAGVECKSYFPMFVYMAYGFYVLMQACIFGCVCSIFLIFFCVYARRMGRPNWQGANNQILNRLVRTRFTPANYNRDEACSVCLDEFKENDEVITLPCSDHHIFHAHCITEWLPRNNVCPLCKEPVQLSKILKFYLNSIVSVENIQNQLNNQRG